MRSALAAARTRSDGADHPVRWSAHRHGSYSAGSARSGLPLLRSGRSSCIITVTVVIRAATEKEGTSEHGHRSDAARDQHGQAVHLVGTAGEAVDGTGDDEDRERKKPAGVDRCRIAGSSGGAAGTRNIPFFSTRASGDTPVPGACSPTWTPPSAVSTTSLALTPTPPSAEPDRKLGHTDRHHENHHLPG